MHIPIGIHLRNELGWVWAYVYVCIREFHQQELNALLFSQMFEQSNTEYNCGLNYTIKLQTFAHRIVRLKVKTMKIFEIDCIVCTKFRSFDRFNVICKLSIAWNPKDKQSVESFMRQTFCEIDWNFVFVINLRFRPAPGDLKTSN